MRAIVEKYFSDLLSGISGITRILSVTTQKKDSREDSRGGVGGHPSDEEGLLLHFFTLCDERKSYNENNKCAAGGSRKTFIEKIEKIGSRLRRGKEKSGFVSTVFLQHTRQAITLKRNEDFPVQNT